MYPSVGNSDHLRIREDNKPIETSSHRRRSLNIQKKKYKQDCNSNAWEKGRRIAERQAYRELGRQIVTVTIAEQEQVGEIAETVQIVRCMHNREICKELGGQ